MTITDLVQDIKEIEDLLDDESLVVIQEKLALNKNPNKDQISRFFQESLAKSEIINLSQGFKSKSEKLISALEERLKS